MEWLQQGAARQGAWPRAVLHHQRQRHQQVRRTHGVVQPAPVLLQCRNSAPLLRICISCNMILLVAQQQSGSSDRNTAEVVPHADPATDASAADAAAHVPGGAARVATGCSTPTARNRCCRLPTSLATARASRGQSTRWVGRLVVSPATQSYAATSGIPPLRSEGGVCFAQLLCVQPGDSRLLLTCAAANGRTACPRPRTAAGCRRLL